MFSPGSLAPPGFQQKSSFAFLPQHLHSGRPPTSHKDWYKNQNVFKQKVTDQIYSSRRTTAKDHLKRGGD